MNIVSPRAILYEGDLDRDTKQALLPLIGDNVMTEKLTANPPAMFFRQTPSYIYLYVIGFSEGRLTVKQQLYYEEDPSGEPENRVVIPHDQVGDRIDSIMGLSGNSISAHAHLEEFGENFANNNYTSGNVQRSTKHWDRLSYLAFVIDHSQWKFCTEKEDGLLPAIFYHKNGLGKVGGNHTIFDGKVDTIGRTGNSRSLFYCVNHLRTKLPQGSPAGRRPKPPSRLREEEFKYDLRTKFDFGPNYPNAILIFDPGGDNQGPPQPPPDLE